MKFDNVPNQEVELKDGRKTWISRSCAVAGIVIAKTPGPEGEIFIACSQRGTASPDYVGYQNLVCGYLDWNESGTQAFIRETWEEIGLNILDLIHNDTFKVLKNDLSQPWKVADLPDQNRQNVTLRYGLVVEIPIEYDLPVLTTVNNEKPNETVKPIWMRLSEFNSYPMWAFGHDQVIIEYVNRMVLEGIIKFSKD